MDCVGCNRSLEVGDRYIMDTPSGFINNEPNPDIDRLIAGIWGNSDGKVCFCEDCTESGGDYLFETFYGEPEASEE